VEGARNFADQALAMGHSVEITCLDSPHSPWLRDSSQHINAIGAGRFANFGYSRHLDLWLTQNIRRFDAVLVNGIWMYFGIAVRRAAVRANVPYFVFTHGALDPWFKHKYPLKQIKKQVYWSLFEHKVLRDAAAVLFTTDEERIVSDKAFWPYVCNAKVVGYGIGDPFISKPRLEDRSEARQRLNLALPQLGDRKFVLFLARVHEKKGVDLLFQAIAKNNPTLQEHVFLIAGPGDPAYITNLKGTAERLGLENRVIWAGALYDDLKWAAIAEAEAYVLPSHQENFGISVAEALACGVPVLITNKVNIWREIVAEGGGFVDNDDVSGVSNLLERWSSLLPEQRSAMRTHARTCFLNHFEITKTSIELFKTIEQTHAPKSSERLSECVS